MSNLDHTNSVRVSATQGVCPIGEITGNKNIENSNIPVLSCEGGCIRGEIARQAANNICKEHGYARGCHGELITVPDSAIARWIKEADQVVLIDGCFLRCHGRILENIIDNKKLVQFDALSHYNRYTDIFDYDDVPEEERKEVARSVSDWIMDSLNGAAAVKTSHSEKTSDSCRPCCG